VHFADCRLICRQGNRWGGASNVVILELIHMDRDLRYYLDAKFAVVDGNFADLRTDMDARFTAVDRKFAELRADMDVRFTTVDQKFTELRADMDVRFTAVDQKVAELRTDLRSEMDVRFAAAREDLEKVETRLLSAFHSWASPMEIKVRQMTTLALGSAERLGLLEDRISAIERRLDLPPA
jgi:hypothetical protein